MPDAAWASNHLDLGTTRQSEPEMNEFKTYLHNELLTKQGTCDSSIPDGLKILKAALKVFLVCEHTQASCTALFISLGNLQQQLTFASTALQ